MNLELNFQRDVIANKPGQLFDMITKGQCQRSMTLPESQNFYFIFAGRSKFFEFVSA
jgi:hypothetical protein